MSVMNDLRAQHAYLANSSVGDTTPTNDPLHSSAPSRLKPPQNTAHDLRRNSAPAHGL